MDGRPLTGGIIIGPFFNVLLMVRLSSYSVVALGYRFKYYYYYYVINVFARLS